MQEEVMTRALVATIPAFVGVLLEHRPASLRGRSLLEVLRLPDRMPEQLLALYQSWQTDPTALRRTAPSLAFAVAGQARAKGLLTPEGEDRLLGRLIAFWALDSTMRDTARSVAAGQTSRVPEATTYGATTAWTGPLAIGRLHPPGSGGPRPTALLGAPARRAAGAGQPRRAARRSTTTPLGRVRAR
jgi:hypothetical protein